MSRSKKTILLADCLGVLLLGLLLSACGSVETTWNAPGVSRFPNIDPVTVTVSPTAATVAAGASRQFTADLQNTAQGATWRVNGIPGGNEAVGTISNGLYTAPLSPPPTGRVTITAVWVGNNITSGSATATIVFSNASLNGQYAFSVTATLADGNGNLTGGVKDRQQATGISQDLAFTGTYSVGPDGRGTATFTGSGWTWNFSLVVLSNDQARLMLLETWGNGGGVMEKQEPADFFTSSLTGDFSFALTGLAAGEPRVTVGRFTLNGQGGVSSGVFDANQAGALSANIAFTGTYDVGVNGRGTVTLAEPGGAKQYRLQILSADRLWLLSLDPSPAVRGVAERQQLAPFDNSQLAGNYIFMHDAALVLGDPAAAIGRFTADGAGSISNRVVVRTAPGSGLVTDTFTGTYNVSSNGRGTMTAENLVFYLVSSQKGFVIDRTSTVGRAGVFEAQQGAPFSTASLAGSFGVQVNGLATGGERFNVQGQFDALSAGNLRGTQDTNQAGSPTQGVSFEGVQYSVDADGRGTITDLSANIPSAVFYVVSPSKYFILGPDQAGDTVLHGVAEKQF
jgi:hypothetical protein